MRSNVKQRILFLKMFKYAGLAAAVAGIMMFVGLGNISVGEENMSLINNVYRATGAIVTLFGIVWYWKVGKRVDREIGRLRSRRVEAFILLFIVGAALLAPMACASGRSACTEECLVARSRVLYMEYFSIMLTMIAGFLAIAPLILGRTVLGPLLQELQGIAGSMLILMIALLLLIYPLDVMFVPNDYENPTCCEISFEALKSEGPPLLRIILSILTPPEYQGD